MFTISSTRTIRVAAVQMQSKLGQTKANLDHAASLAEQAARQGAELIAYAELAASGYSMSPLVWEWAEPRGGYTTQWLQATSRRLGVYLGMGFCEVDGADFYNTYALSAPDGRIAGYVRKIMAETYVFRCARDSQVIQTEIGRVGIAICADNMVAPNIQRMQASAADLLLMPHAVPVPTKVGGLVSPDDMNHARQTLRDKGPLNARLLGIPTVFINQVGPMGTEKWSGIMGHLLSADGFRLGGLSAIAAADGTTCAQLGELGEDALVADVALDPTRKVSARPKRYGRYGGGAVSPLHPVFEVLCYVDAFLGRVSYTLSGARKQKARQMARQPQPAPDSIVAAPIPEPAPVRAGDRASST